MEVNNETPSDQIKSTNEIKLDEEIKQLEAVKSPYRPFNRPFKFGSASKREKRYLRLKNLLGKSGKTKTKQESIKPIDPPEPWTAHRLRREGKGIVRIIASTDDPNTNVKNVDKKRRRRVKPRETKAERVERLELKLKRRLASETKEEKSLRLQRARKSRYLSRTKRLKEERILQQFEEDQHTDTGISLFIHFK